MVAVSSLLLYANLELIECLDIVTEIYYCVNLLRSLTHSHATVGFNIYVP